MVRRCDNVALCCICQAVFTKRRYRDSWNRTVLRRIAKVHNHSLKAPRIACNRVSSCRCTVLFVCRARGSVVCPHRPCEVKARVRARGTRGQNWYGEKKVNFIRSRVRTQNSWLLHLAGDHHANYETKQTLHRAHLMRCMLSANLAVDQRPRVLRQSEQTMQGVE